MVLIGAGTNYNDVPDKPPPIPPGTYRCLIETEPEFKKTNDGSKDKVVVIMKIDCPENPLAHDKLLWDHIVVNDTNESKLKRIFLSAGLTIGPSGLDLADLIGATLQVRVVPDTWKKDDGSVDQVARVGDYLVEA